MMETIKIQINHTEPLTLDMLAQPLYDMIGEEYDIEIDEVKSYFSFEHCAVLPSDSFISIIVISLPPLETRDVSISEIVLSYLNSLNEFDNVDFITKINDTGFQKMAIAYYQQIILILNQTRT